VKPGSSGRFEISQTADSPILKCLKNRAVVFIKEIQVCSNTEIDTTDTLESNGWLLGLTHLQQKCFVDVLKKQALVGTARKSLRWKSIAIQSIAGVVQIEELSSQ
jgi:predicted GNAT family N-acyltransferase